MLIMENVSFRYNKKELFKELVLELKPGNIYGLLGKNGAGKTTLLKIMGGLLFSETGKCTFNDFDVTKRDPQFLEDLFFLPEEFFLPPVKGSVFLNLRSPFYPNFDHKAFNYYIDEFDIPLEKSLNTLSFGQKKKFLLSFGLATSTKIMIMDEPTNGLDIPSKTTLRKIIAKSMTEDRIILISTHQVKDVENLIDPVIMLDDGKVIFNWDINSISSKLKMGSVSKLNGNELFTQEVMGGYEVVTVNEDKEDYALNLELLFNAVTSNSKNINDAIKVGSYE
ncbi:MAG: ABC transporter ATP-binding protein [Spirochaetales bacterium]|nr:ABC transporter ATP-binding protein [Spirochaetales bacterium]